MTPITMRLSGAVRVLPLCFCLLAEANPVGHRVVRADPQKPPRPEYQLSVEFPLKGRDPGSSVCNPYLINSIAWNRTGTRMVVGAGSDNFHKPECQVVGIVQIFDTSTEKPELLNTLTDSAEDMVWFF